MHVDLYRPLPSCPDLLFFFTLVPKFFASVSSQLRKTKTMASLMGLLALLAGGAQLAEASATCDQLSALGSIDIAKLFDIDYTSIGNDYW